jgi:putative intracellular protease/amidase
MSKTIAVVMVDGVADWEIGPILPSARTWFGDRVMVASLDGEPVLSMGGLRIQPDAAFADLPLLQADLWLLPGSERWQEGEIAPLSEALRARIAAGKPVAAICGATLALANAGLLNAAAHTSNSPEFLSEYAKGYSGSAHYRAERVLRDGNLITAPGSSPVSFAVECLRMLHPDQEAGIAEMRAMFAGEFSGA